MYPFQLRWHSNVYHVNLCFIALFGSRHNKLSPFLLELGSALQYCRFGEIVLFVWDKYYYCMSGCLFACFLFSPMSIEQNIPWKDVGWQENYEYQSLGKRSSAQTLKPIYLFFIILSRIYSTSYINLCMSSSLD